MQITLIGPDLVPDGRLVWLSCTVVRKLNAKGTFTAQVVADDPVARRITQGSRLFIRDPEAGSYSVLVTTIERSMTSDGVYSLNLSGVDDMLALEERITYPNTGKDIWDQKDTDYYEASGSAGQVITDLVRRNLGAVALPYRQWYGLVVDASTVGGQVSVKTRLKTVLEEAATAAELGNVRMVCGYRPDRRIHFTVEACADRSRSMVFRQETGTLGEWTVSVTAPEATTVIIGGKGDLRERVMGEQSMPPEDTWGWRAEKFKDQTDAEDQVAVDEAGKKEAALLTGSAAVTLTANERAGATGAGKVFDRDYFLGDTVTARLGGVNYTDKVQQATVAWDKAGRSVKLTIGKTQDQSTASPAWVRRVRDLEKAQRNLETR